MIKKQELKRRLAIFPLLAASMLTLSAFLAPGTGRAAPPETETREMESLESQKIESHGTEQQETQELPSPAPTDAARVKAGLEPVSAAAAKGPRAAGPENPANAKSENALSATEILAGTQVIAHGLGSIEGVPEGSAPLNCLETFLAQYEAGVRVFEADLRLTRDAEVVLRHDWWPYWQEGIDGASIPTLEDFLSKPILEKYTPLSFRDLLLLMEQYTDVCIITDTKFIESDVVYIEFDAMIADAEDLGLTGLFDRMVIQVYNGDMHQCLEKIYPFPHRIYTLYVRGFKQTRDDFREVAEYCVKHGIEGITMCDYWWDAKYAPIALEYGIKVYVHTVNDVSTAQKFLKSGVNGVYTDILAPKDLA